MQNANPEFDAYIASAEPFAQPILKQLRKLVHRACPEVTEVIKWSMPFFDWQGPLCHMAAFQRHCALGFWKAELLIAEDQRRDEAMGQFGRITQLAELPSEEWLVDIIHRAMALNEAGVRAPRQRKPAVEAVAPPELIAALSAVPAAVAAWKGFSNSKRREYADWLEEAKTEATRQRRLASAVEWIAEGKARNWKYEKPAR